MSRLPRLLIAAFAFSLVSLVRAAEPIELPVWTGTPPGSEGSHPAEKVEERGKNGVVDRAIREVHTPTLTVYLPEKGAASGVAVVLAPGGGYEHVTIDKEGHDVARMLVTHGIAGIVLKYRLPHTPGAKYTTDTALADAVQSLKIVRAHASEWGIDPAKVGFMGFSAGGNMAALVGTKPAKEDRPDFLGLMYPVVGADFGAIPVDTPPAFIVQADDDMLGTENAMRFYTWERAHKIAADLHLFTKGGHGFGLGKPGTATVQWPALFVSWLEVTKFLPAAK